MTRGRKHLKDLAAGAGLIPVGSVKGRLTAQRRRALCRAGRALVASGHIAQGEALVNRMKEAEYQSRLRKARRVNGR